MGIIRKRLATSSEPCGVSSGDEPAEGDSAQPPDESSKPSPSTIDSQDKRSRRAKPASDVTRPLTIVRVRSKPRQLTTTLSETGAPDWSLSAGVATVLFGFAVAFGTYVTLTQRDAVQSRLHHVASRDEPRAAAPHVPLAQIDPAPASEPVSRNPDTAPATTALAERTAPQHQAEASPAASAPAGVMSHATTATIAAAPQTATQTAKRTAPPPPSAAASAPPPTVARAATTQRTLATAAASPAPARQSSKNTDDGSPATATHARVAPSASTTSPAAPTPPAQKDRRVAQKAAKPACGPLKSCDEAIARDDRVVREPASNVRPSTKITTAATVVRDAASSVSAVQISQMAPPAQPPTPAETTAALSASVNRELFRRH